VQSAIPSLSDELFSAGQPRIPEPKGDEARQAVDALRGYAYQVMASALAWMNLADEEHLYLEVAEDFAVVAADALNATQVKDTAASGSITLNSEAVRTAIGTFVELQLAHPAQKVQLHYLTTAAIGTERLIADRPGGMAGLDYWRLAAAGADVKPIRLLLQSIDFPESVRKFCTDRGDDELRRDLLRRIHWDCGSPDLAGLKSETEGRLVMVGRDQFGVPAPEARRLATSVFYEVLKTSVAPKPSDRRLTKAALYELIDGLTSVVVPRSALGALTALQGGNQPLTPQISAEDWLVSSDDLPLPRGVIDRPELEGRLTALLAKHPTAMLWGGTGVGKSLIARKVGKGLGGYALLDFRDADGAESHRRLQTLLPQISQLPHRVLIIEDLNQLEDNRVEKALGMATEAARRHDVRIIITLYRAPLAATLAILGVDPSASVECPYFDEGEVNALIALLGGDPSIWTKLALVSGGVGHPQLTHAFALGMASRNWPPAEIVVVVTSGLSSEETAAARDAARRKLTRELPEPQRDLLYRLSVSTGRFDRATALTLGNAPPPIDRCAEQFDQLVGPWVDVIGKDSYRVSPLASGLGREMLDASQQKQTHELLAMTLIQRSTLTPSDMDMVLTHALAGESRHALMAFSRAIMAAGEKTRSALADQLMVLPFLRTDREVFPQEPSVSVMLRLAQFKLDMDGERKQPRRLIEVLREELELVKDGPMRAALEALVIPSLLINMGASNYIDGWITMILSFSDIGNLAIADLRANVERPDLGANLANILFNLGGAAIQSVAKLEDIIGQLDAVSPEERAALLRPLPEQDVDHAVMINSPWVSENRADALDAADAAERYLRIAKTIHAWGRPDMAAQAWIARAVMFDEYLNIGDKAVAELDEAIATLGQSIALERARAKIHYRAGNHSEALRVMRKIASDVGAQSAVERAFALREGAISAAKVGDHKQAREWFEEASRSAAMAQTEEMRCMAVGLLADAGIAAYRADVPGDAISLMEAAVMGLGPIDPDGSLSAAYLYRVMGHAALWLSIQVAPMGDREAEMEPGACSNPDPPKAIRDRPLGEPDFVWYMLAEVADAHALGEPVCDRLLSHISGGRIFVSETTMAIQRIEHAVDRLDTKEFTTRLKPAVSAIASYRTEPHRHREFSTLAPERAPLTHIDENQISDLENQAIARSLVTAFALCAAAAGKPEVIEDLAERLKSSFEAPLASDTLGAILDEKTAIADADETIVACCRQLLTEQPRLPSATWEMALRLFEWTIRSALPRASQRALEPWFRAQFVYIIEEQSFRLVSPLRTVPPIRAALEDARSRPMMAKLLLAGSDAVDRGLSKEFRELLERERDR
jgi:tetratricopeptide (TPR) repeat protein